MTEKETIGVLAVLKAAYPQQLNKTSEEEANAIIQIWLEQFKQTQGNIVMLAAQKLIATSTYFPTIAEIKEKIKKLHYEALFAIQQHDQFIEIGVGTKLSDEVLKNINYIYENTYSKDYEQTIFELVGAKYNPVNDLIEKENTSFLEFKEKI